MQQTTIVNKNIEETFECIIYTVKLKSKCHAKRHIEIVHNNIKDFKCYSCAKKLSFKSHLQRHIKCWQKIKNFECSICDKKFGHNIYGHIRTVHKDEKFLNAIFAIINLDNRAVFGSIKSLFMTELRTMNAAIVVKSLALNINSKGTSQMFTIISKIWNINKLQENQTFIKV